MTTRSAVRSSRLARLFSLDLLDGLHVRLRRPHRREALAGCFRILHRLVVFGIDDVQTGRPAGGQELLIGADDRKPERLQLQRQGQMQQLR